MDTMMHKVDELDIKLISELCLDGRASFRELAEKLGVAEGTVYNRVTKLREAGIIKGFLADVDFEKLGFGITALIGIRVSGGHLAEIEKKIALDESITAVYDVTGEYDAVVVAKFRERSELNSFVKKLTAMDNVERTYTMMVLNVVKEQHKVGLG
jgi:Lrp/AsnC family transcriptional regulator for asnA, asnC and gidA